MVIEDDPIKELPLGRSGIFFEYECLTVNPKTFNIGLEESSRQQRELERERVPTYNK